MCMHVHLWAGGRQDVCAYECSCPERSEESEDPLELQIQAIVESPDLGAGY